MEFSLPCKELWAPAYDALICSIENGSVRPGTSFGFSPTYLHCAGALVYAVSSDMHTPLFKERNERKICFSKWFSLGSNS